MTTLQSMTVTTLAMAASLLTASCGGNDNPAPLPPVQLSLISLNDFHGNLQPPSGGVVAADPVNPAGTRVSAGGAAYSATLVATLKAQNPGNTLVVAAGDMIGASPLVSGLFHDEPTIDLLGMDGKLITQTGFYGRVAAKIDLTIDPGMKKVTKKGANDFVAINDVGAKDAKGVLIPLPVGQTPQAKNAAIDALVQRYVTLTAPITSIVLGNLTGFLDRKTKGAGESTLGDVIADSFLASSSDASHGTMRAQIAFTNPGGIRADLTMALQITFGQLYKVQPFGNNLVTLDLTGDQLLRLLEQQWESPQLAGGRKLPVSAGSTYT